MDILIIPDVHLKPWMFEKAADLLLAGVAGQAVCLMDIADDWGQQFNIGLYESTYDAAADFAQKFPDTLWCWGNHDQCYMWNKRESGYSGAASQTVCRKIYDLQTAVPDRRQFAYIHRIGNVLFSHGGLSEQFVERHVPEKDRDNTDAVVEAVNRLGCRDMWQNTSPLWLRPQYGSVRMYREEDLLQVVGHTPVRTCTKRGNLISCDVFSTYSNGDLFGDRMFPVIDTETWEMHCLACD